MLLEFIFFSYLLKEKERTRSFIGERLEASGRTWGSTKYMIKIYSKKNHKTFKNICRVNKTFYKINKILMIW